jgi:hypothetical protein
MRAKAAQRCESTRGAVAALIAGVLLICASNAWAGKKIIFSPFSGPRGDEATERVRGALGALGSVTPAAYARAKMSYGAEGAAKKLGIVAQVRGSIMRVRGRFALKLIISTIGGKVLSSQTFLLRGSHLDPSTVSSAARLIRTAANKAGGGQATKPKRRPKRRRRRPPKKSEPPPPVKTAPATQPALPMGPPPADGSDLQVDSAIGDDWSGRDPYAGQRTQTARENGMGFVVSRPGTAGPGDAAVPARPVRSAGRPTAGGEGKARYASLGYSARRPSPAPRSRIRQQKRQEHRSARRMTMMQQLAYDDSDDNEADDDEDDPRRWTSIIRASAGLAFVNRSLEFSGAEISGYSTPALIPAVYATGVIYPFALFFDDWLANLGLAARTYYAIGLASENPSGGQSSGDILQMADIGPRYRWILEDDSARSPIVLFGLDLGFQAFQLGVSSNSPNAIFPNALYTYVKPTVALDWPFLATGSVRGGANAALDVPLVLASEPLGSNSTSYGKTKTIAFEISFGFYASVAGFFGQLDFFYRHFQMSMDSTTCNNTGCVVVDGARDMYLGMMAHAGYAY